MAEQTYVLGGLEADLAAERRRLVRLCAYLTGSEAAAEDLAQETMLEAWRHMHKLSDPEGLAKWLSAIARNVCLRWTRSRGREIARRALGSKRDHEDTIRGLPAPDEDGILEMQLEREELAELLDRALALLPPQTREVLIERYVEELPQAEVAARLGVSEGAVAKRLERGKLMLRRLLTTELAEEAAVYGLVPPRPGEAQRTRIWCTDCGRSYLYGSFDPVAGSLDLRCPACSTAPDLGYVKSRLPQIFAGLKSFKPALSRLNSWCFTYYSQGLAAGSAACINCGRPAPVSVGNLRDISPRYPDRVCARMICGACGRDDNWHTVEGMCLALPEGRRFWRDYPRLKIPPARELEVSGRPALLTSLRSLSSAARLDVIHDRETLRVIAVHESGG